MPSSPRRDEFKDVGKHFGEGAYAELPVDGSQVGRDYTVEGWFIWLSGPGPLLTTANDELAFIYDRDGECAYRLGGTERVTVVPSRAARDHWIYLAVAKTGPNVVCASTTVWWIGGTTRPANRASQTSS